MAQNCSVFIEHFAVYRKTPKCSPRFVAFDAGKPPNYAGAIGSAFFCEAF
jgi:hypothetical protein